jgi:hypothetical protein
MAKPKTQLNMKAPFFFHYKNYPSKKANNMCYFFLVSTDKQMERTYNKTLKPEHLARTN